MSLKDRDYYYVEDSNTAIDNTDVSNCWIYPYENWNPSITYTTSYPVYYVDKGEKAINIAKKLVEKKIIEAKKTEEFIKLIELIKGCL